MSTTDRAGAPILPIPDPPPELTQVLNACKGMIERIRFSAEPGSVVEPHALVLAAGEQLAVIEMPGCSDLDTRVYLRGELARSPALCVAVATEAWAAWSADPAECALIDRLHAAGRLQDAPPHLLRSVIRVYAEHANGAIVLERNELRVTADGSRSLGTWEPAKLVRPRPNFRRYFPETP